ncbi:extracellular solute-binding protein [Bradyrhizobium sp. 137]|uniref:extracellular solute-binding protein n=1 Tax=Bradyrhizobium sp. 137 TaxID=2782614 RepID=UPI001FFB84C1|nr:extracellular solute-binding protein [Bradyrhizobium sp. 137]MCK1759094.1 extracellular solute-binding protein [Bradyrhizobium sp. 137]
MQDFFDLVPFFAAFRPLLHSTTPSANNFALRHSGKRHDQPECRGRFILRPEPPFIAAVKRCVIEPASDRPDNERLGAGKARRVWGSSRFHLGGSYTEGVRRYVFEPFKQATGIKVVEAVGDLPVPLVKAMYHAGRVDWDIAYLPRKNYPEMHEAGMFVPIDYSLWDQESLDGTPPEARRKDAVYIDHNSEVLAYEPRAFPDGGPQTWVDFWDVKKFPGPRGLYASRGQNNIRYALIASGFAKKDMWPLTDDKLDIAFKKLNEIKPHISKWWSAGGEPAQLLINREYAVTSIYDGRAIAAIRQEASIKFSWKAPTWGPPWGWFSRVVPTQIMHKSCLPF